MAENRLLDDVRQWLEGRGYVLEMIVARKFAARGAMVQQGYHFTDSVTGKEREDDVSVLLPIGPREETHAHAVQVIIECKNTDAPWVFFMGHAGFNGGWSPTINFHEECRSCERISNVIWRLERQRPEAYAVTEKRSKSSERDLAYESAQQVASAAHALYREPMESSDAPGLTAAFGIPIVVTTSPLIACRLDTSGEVHLEQVERAGVLVPRLDLPEQYADGVSVTVVTLSGLDALIDDLLTIEGHTTGQRPDLS